MWIRTILWLLASITLVAGSAAAESTILVCHDGDECKIVHSDAAPSRGTYTKASVPTPAPRRIARYDDESRNHRIAYPNVGLRRYIIERDHRHHSSCGHAYQPRYRSSYGYRSGHLYRGHRGRSYYGRSYGRGHGRSYGTGRHHPRRHSRHSRGHHRGRRTRF
ncbi:MAG: hypothetical protein JRH01_00185 [Deltaproteobacteria bacterium]|nr:hypothetical protein [Deltaproteobacteria bacterium]MBW2392815.1 hypothetical protein [Deltaproteobacteria bacterium]